ncbi:CRE-CAT-2 protein [Caenorhabditis remanei]|uniref:CRE-CAT-2 protein n=1 Tax=Caenorhabditis remanei TaxID=31234 RepID=E3N325_CAERE|nr:CRE-CAT-2 protein [Caenorhabditis remanei]
MSSLTNPTIMEEETPPPPPPNPEKGGGASSKNPRRYSLVHQASCETQHHIGIRRQNTIQHRKQLTDQMRGQKILQQLNDEGVEVIFAAPDVSAPIEFSVIATSTDSLAPFLTDILKNMETAHVTIGHVETRPSKKDSERGGASFESSDSAHDVLLSCRATKTQLIHAAELLTQNHGALQAFSIFSINKSKSIDKNQSIIWFPRHISELDRCSKCITKYEPTTDPRHPGHGDEEYIKRRKYLNDLALEFKFGDEIDYVEYTEEEHATWKAVYEKLCDLHVSHTCTVYRQNLKILQTERVLTADRIPQIRDVNKFLQKKTGFELRPCSGLLSARDFLASLAFRVFQTTTYLRHHASPHHSPEPDLIHELLGHVPMFSDPLLAQMSQDIGLMSLGASDEHIEKLATVYWYVMKDWEVEGNRSGITHACSDVPEHKDFEPAVTAIQKYEDSDYQPLYFVADSIHDALAKLRKYASSMDRPFSVVYDPFTKSIETIESSADLEKAFSRLSNDLSAITHAADRMKISVSM